MTIKSPTAHPLFHVVFRLAAVLGGIVVGLARAGIELCKILKFTISASLRERREPGEVVRQMYQVGNRSLLFVAVTMGFLAMVSIYQVCLQLNRVTGDLSKVGAEFVKLLIHETGPTITAMMLCTRVGAGIAAEVGSMMVTEQVDALRMNGVNPISYLIVPRFLASLVMVPVMVIFADGISVLTGSAMGYYHFGINPKVFIDFTGVTFGDVITGLTKSLSYGVAIPIISGYCGLTTYGGSEGVGSATTRAVINSSLAVILLDFILGMLSFLLFHTKVGT